MNLKFLEAALELFLSCSKYRHFVFVQSCWVPLPRYLVSAGKRSGGRAGVCLLFRTFLIEMTVSQRTRAKKEDKRNPFSSLCLFSVVGTQRDKIFGSSLFLLYILLLMFSPSFWILVIAVSLLLSMKQT